MNDTQYPKFLSYKTTRISLSPKVWKISTEELVKLRDAIQAFRDVLKLREEHLHDIISSIVLTHTDFGTLLMNKELIPDIILQLNNIIGTRSLAALQERKRRRKEDGFK